MVRLARSAVVLLLGLAACNSGGGGSADETGPDPTMPTTTDDPGDTTTGGEPGLEPPGEPVEPTKMRDLSPDPTAEEIATMAGDELGFAIDLFKALPADEMNRVISPTSLRIAFAQAYEGARTVTEAEIQQVLHFSLAKPRLHNAFNALDLALEGRDLAPSGEVDGDDSVTLDLYNQMFGRPDVAWKPAWLDVLAESYGTRLNLLDFAADPDGARTRINDWVYAATREKIVDLLPPGSIGSNVIGVLVNAMYLKAPWDSPFEYVNENGTFHLEDGSLVVAPMMSQTFEGSRLYSGAGVQAVEIPLRGGDLRFVAVVPDAGTFDAFTAGLDAAGLRAILDGFEYTPVHLTLPRFAFSSDYALRKPLNDLGMTTAFVPDVADFSGMSSGAAWISDVYHQVYVGVDEKGVEAAAATAIVFEGTTDAPVTPEKLAVDRPFYFAIRDVETDATLFFGRVLDPR